MGKIAKKLRVWATWERGQYYGFMVLAVLLAVFWVVALHDRTLPFAEGWYTYYAKCINQGLLPYRDFEYLYPPVYIYTVALITKIFGYDLIILRRLGILFFALIALGLYLSATVIVGKQRSYMALIAALTGAFYLQSEVVQTFYDYVRMMDVFAVFSLYFLLKTVRGMAEGGAYRKSLLLCGLFCAVFINIKQNIGLIFFAYVLALLLYVGLWCRHGKRVILADLGLLLLPVAAATALIGAALLASGSLPAYLSMTGGAAASAKGGMRAILFGWITNNSTAFLHGLPVALLLLAIIAGGYLWLRFVTTAAPYQAPHTSKQHAVIGLCFAAFLAAGLAALISSRAVGLWLLPTYFLSTYTVFLAVAPLFAACGVWGIFDIARKQQKLRPLLLPFALGGAYFAISFGCGNSGGLAEGQASFGVLFLVLALLWLGEQCLAHVAHTPWRATCGQGARAALALLCLLLVLQSADKKLVYPYNWWGMTEADYWESTESLTLPFTRGIRVSAETRAVYEEICRTVTANTSLGDPIFCFPHVPLFYVLCDRPDPNTNAKVQWFDVASDAAIRADIARLQQDPPKAILIYHTSPAAYEAHEQAFRGGKRSATREMRDFLLLLVEEKGYRLAGRYVAGDNALSLWIAVAP